MRRKDILLCAVIVASTSPAAAQQATTATVTPAEIVVRGQQYENKVVCRQQQNTGTRFATRVCNTNKVWDEMREQQLRAAREMIDKAITQADTP